LFSEANRDGTDAECYRCLSFFLPHLRTLAQEKRFSFWNRWAESLFVSIIVAKYNIFPSLTTAARAKKKAVNNEENLNSQSSQLEGRRSTKVTG